MPSTERKVKASELFFKAGELILGESRKEESGATHTPVKLVVRTSSAVETWHGPMVHDLSGMFHNDTVALDWVHDENSPADIIGLLDKFDQNNDRIECSGEIVSLADMDIADQVVKKLRAKIPFESSISFC